MSTSLTVKPLSCKALSSTQLADEPLATATFLPFSPATSVMSSPLTRMPWFHGVVFDAATASIFAPDEAAKIGGASPTPPMSIASALSASSIGGPEVNDDHSMPYGVSACPDASSSAWVDLT